MIVLTFLVNVVNVLKLHLDLPLVFGVLSECILIVYATFELSIYQPLDMFYIDSGLFYYHNF